MNPDLPPANAPAKRVRSNLRQRVVWGTIAATLLIGCTYGGPISFGLFFAAVQAVMLKEFYRIMRANGYRPASWVGVIIGVLIFSYLHLFTGFFHYAQLFGWQTGWTTYPSLSALPQILPGRVPFWMVLVRETSYFLIVAGALLMVVVLVREIIRWPHHGQPFLNLAATLGGLFYISLPMGLLNVLAFNRKGYDARHVFCLIVLVWAADTGAYFAGKNFGRHKLAPSISPGKTWEGWAGGALLALVTGWAFGQFVPDIPLTHRLVAAGVVAVFGPLGDLAESMLKRSAGVKDSGTFLPGHGGLLDRFDAFLLVLPVLALLQLLAG
ncbi:phosphatidate cytidylyltransferase [Hymenobacter caeli]|uniref:Phosphatidate cytidylyltransferase n=1 Tax=Hymenobacter caeli TaxID=2735894 RepID=A0ABX2FSG9_9BACT|nr:phosphatidate cytidylyltransferase [Hymenobacter caeli]NRT19309.1 phosphatidate cytidylyltransferase [Hymenobacter caeli]